MHLNSENESLADPETKIQNPKSKIEKPIDPDNSP